MAGWPQLINLKLQDSGIDDECLEGASWLFPGLRNLFLSKCKNLKDEWLLILSLSCPHLISPEIGYYPGPICAGLSAVASQLPKSLHVTWHWATDSDLIALKADCPSLLNVTLGMCTLT